MNWKQYLIKKGFTYSENDDDYRLALGFGRVVKVWTLMRGMFIIERNGKTVYRGFPDSFSQFKEVVDNIKN